MNLTAAVPSVLPSASKDASATTGPDAVHADTSESQTTTVSGLPTREEAIDMIQAARWWSPNLTCNPEPLSTLLSNNAKEESGWLRNLLFPGSIDTAYAADDSNQYQQDLTLTYLLTFAESKGLASEIAEAWNMSLESAIEARKVTVDKAGIYYPVNKVICDTSSKGQDVMIAALVMYPYGCLRPTWKYTSVDRIQMLMLDAALHSGGHCRHTRIIQYLFKCAASSVKTNSKNILKKLFDGFVPEPALPPHFHQAVNKYTGRMVWFNSETKTAQWTRPGLPLPLPVSTNTEEHGQPSVVVPGAGTNSTTEPTEPSPTSVTEVSTKENTTTSEATAVNDKPSSVVPSAKRTPFGNKSNANTSINTIPTKGKLGILKNGATVGTKSNKPINLGPAIDPENIAQK